MNDYCFDESKTTSSKSLDVYCQLNKFDDQSDLLMTQLQID